MTDAATHDEVASLEARRKELEQEGFRLRARLATIERDRPELVARADAATDLETARKLTEELCEVDLEAKVCTNRTAAVARELAHLRGRHAEAVHTANRRRVAALIDQSDPIFVKVLNALDELGELRRRAVAEGAPEPLLPPPPGEPVPDRHSDVIAFTIADRLAAYLRRQWAAEIVPGARALLSGEHT